MIGAVDTLCRVEVLDPAEPAAPLWGSDAMRAGAVRDAIGAVRSGVPTVLDVIVEPGYTPAMSAGISGR